MKNISSTLDHLSQVLPLFEAGTVWLAGAGPGDPGLLTLHAFNAIRQADHILYDALVDESILKFARHDVVLEFAGKRGGKPSPKQHEITARIIELAQNNKRVLRLKGGDPFVFGRGGEEARALIEAGISFRVIPGVTSGIAGPAYAGISVTSRAVNQSLLFLTGHDADGGVPKNFDWHAIARSAPVIVLYMAMRHIGEITGYLLAAGRRADEPVAFISQATTQKQRLVLTTLAHAQTDVKKHHIEAPAVIVIGKAAGQDELLDWVPFTQPMAEEENK